MTEAFAALAGGADVLKMFPATQLRPAVITVWSAVIPHSVALLPVGRITPENLAKFINTGTSIFVLESALYAPGMSALAGIDQALWDIKDKALGLS